MHKWVIYKFRLSYYCIIHGWETNTDWSIYAADRCNVWPYSKAAADCPYAEAWIRETR